LPVDISLDGEYCLGNITVYPEKIVLSIPDQPEYEYLLEEISSFKVEKAVGNNLLIGEKQGEEILITRFSDTLIAKYSELATYLNQRKANPDLAPLVLPEDDFCPKCKRRYISGSKVCPHCLNKVAVLIRLWPFVKKHFWLALSGTVIYFILSGFRLISPQIQRLLIDKVLLVNNPSIRLLVTYILMMAGISLLSSVLTVLRGFIMSTMGAHLTRDLRFMVYSKIQQLSLNYITAKKTGDLMNRVNHDTNTLQRFIQNYLAMGISEVILFIGIVIILFSRSWQLALLILLPVPFVAWFATKHWDKVNRMYRHQWRKFDRVNSLLQDVLSGIRVVKAFGQEHKEVKRFQVFSQEFAEVSARNEKSWNTIFPILGHIMGVGNFIVLYFGSKLVLNQQMQIGELVQFSVYTRMLYGPLDFINYFPRWFSEAMTAAERIFEVIDVKPEVNDPVNPVQHSIEGKVEITDLTFGYEKYNPVLKEINLQVEKGEMIGLVGPSGAGKSTLINLICRFYDPDKGQIKIDGIDLKEYDQQMLRSQIGVVLQETFLFMGSIYENIAYAKPDATPLEVMCAAKIANAHDFIMKFTDGYDTLVGERGQRLSGGERQRIAIARAILHNPKVLILDEATASVDTETEYQIQEALGRLIKNRTTFAIAHRLSTLRNADRIVVIDNGRITESGTHDELMAQEGLYYRLVSTQRKMSRIKGVDG
jgi:ATP-binding cassette subfamily B protein